MKPKTMILITVAIGCGAIVAVYANSMLNPNSKDPIINVLRAKDKVSSGSLLKDEQWLDAHFALDQIKLSEMAAAKLYNPATSFEQLKPKLKDHVLEKTLNQGDYLSMDNIIDRTKSGLAARLHEGFTGYSINGDAASLVAGHIQPEISWVEVHTIRRTPGGEKIPKVLMRNVRVVAVDQESKSNPEGGATRVPTTVTLEVTNQEVKVLRNASEDAGRITLSLIGVKDLEKLTEDERYDPKNRKGEDESKRVEKVSLDQLLRPGFTAFSVKVTADSAGAGLILPENRVKVIGLRRRVGGERKESYLLMKNIRVLAVDDVTSTDRDNERVISAKTITLEVTDNEAKKLIEHQDEAPLSLGLIPRSELKNKTDEQLDKDRSGEVIDKHSDPLPVAASPKIQPRLVNIISATPIVYQIDENNVAKQIGGSGGNNQPYTPPAPAPAPPAPGQ